MITTRREEHDEHVGDAHARRRRAKRRDENASAADRPHDERLQQPALGVAAHRAERQEHGEHDAQEERPEHRQPEQRRAGERRRVDPPPAGRDVRDVVERMSAPSP